MPSNGLAKLQKRNPLICDQPSEQIKLHWWVWLVSHIPSNNDCGGGNFCQKFAKIDSCHNILKARKPQELSFETKFENLVDPVLCDQIILPDNNLI